METMFWWCRDLVKLDLSSFDTSKVTNMTNMFARTEVLQEVKLGEKFSFSGNGDTSCVLPTQTSRYVPKATGKWYNEEGAEYEADSIVYSLFNSKSQQSSLRNIDYKGKQWNIYNHFFWMSKDEMMELANQYNNDDVYNDARTDKERYTYEMIEQYKSKMSKEALDVLNKATELVIKSFKYRELFNQDNMEYQINLIKTNCSLTFRVEPAIPDIIITKHNDTVMSKYCASNTPLTDLAIGIGDTIEYTITATDYEPLTGTVIIDTQNQELHIKMNKVINEDMTE
jgi:surface protein